MRSSPLVSRTKTDEPFPDQVCFSIAGSAELQAALKDPAVIKAFKDMGAERVGQSPEAFAAFVKSDTTRWRNTAGDAAIKVE